MQNLKVQTRNGDCAIYNLANVLQDEDIISYSLDMEPPFGIHEQNQVLEKAGWDTIRVQPYIGSYNPDIAIPIDFFILLCLDIITQVEKVDITKEETTPFLLGVQANSLLGGLGLHAVTLFRQRGNWYLSDPRWLDWILLTDLHQVLQYYDYINSVYLLVDEKERQICIKSKVYEKES